MTAIEQKIDVIVRQSCESVLQRYVERAPASSPSPPAMPMTVVIGLSGQRLKGALGLCATADVIAATYPLPIRGEVLSEAALHDWLAELSNQFLGSIKREFLSYGVSLWPTLPVSLRGLNIEVAPLQSQEAGLLLYSFASNYGTLFAWFDLEYPSDFQLKRQPIDQLQTGECILF